MEMATRMGFEATLHDESQGACCPASPAPPPFDQQFCRKRVTNGPCKLGLVLAPSSDALFEWTSSAPKANWDGCQG